MCNDPNLHPRIRGGYMIIILVTNTPLLYPPKNIISKKSYGTFLPPTHKTGAQQTNFLNLASY